MQKGKLTVGVPVYNGEQFIERCLQSLCAENLDYRVIIADNCSTDRTGEIARDYAARDPRLTYHCHDENKGGVYNYIYCLRHTDAEYFCWRAYDDLSTPRFFEKAVKALDAEQQCQLAVSEIRFEDSDGNPPQPRPVPDTLPESIEERRKVLFKYFTAGWFYGVYRRDELDRRFHEIKQHFDYLWAYDTLMLLPFVLSGSICTIPGEHFTEYLCGQSASRYRPKGVIRPAHMVYQYCRYGFRCVDDVAQSRAERWKLYRDVIRFANGGAEKFDRIAKRAVFWPYYRLRGRL